MSRSPRRFEIYWVKLDPTVGSEIRKTRPCVVVSPDFLNSRVLTVIVAPLTSVIHGYRIRPKVKVAQKSGQVVIEQLRTVDKTRLQKKIGVLDEEEAASVLISLQEMFAA